MVTIIKKNFFCALGRCEEAAMVEFTIACRKQQNDQKAQALKKCLFSGNINNYLLS